MRISQLKNLPPMDAELPLPDGSKIPFQFNGGFVTSEWVDACYDPRVSMADTANRIAAALVSIDLTDDDDQQIPLTGEALRAALPNPLLMGLVIAMQGAQNAPKKSDASSSVSSWTTGDLAEQEA